MFQAGVREYRERYWTPEYEPRSTDVLAAFRLTPQSEVPAEEAAAAVAAALKETASGLMATRAWTGVRPVAAEVSPP